MRERIDLSQVDADVVAARLDVDPSTGPTEEEAERRLREDRPNELRGKMPIPTRRKVVAQFQDPLIHLLRAAVAISPTSWVVQGAS